MPVPLEPLNFPLTVNKNDEIAIFPPVSGG